MEFHECYALSYQEARRKFTDVARAAGASLQRYIHETERGPNGEELSIDVARLGDAAAPRQLLILSGTHGQEGFAGSAAQIAWMKGDTAPGLPAGVSVLAVHALNPWGFAHFSRTTENNVDLNRNFVDHGSGYPRNPGYEALHAKLLVEDWTTAALAGVERELEAYKRAHGEDALFNALASGQYTHPEGLNYGGNRREWSNLTLERIISDHLSRAERVGIIDWHTGLGDYGKPLFLCFNSTGSSEFAQAARWWSAERVRDQRPNGLARPDYRGLVFYGVQKFLAGRRLCGAVVEFGTRGLRMRRALRLDLWLKFKAERGTDRYQMLMADMRDAFCPVEQAWRDAVIREGVGITAQAIAGLATW